MLGLGAVVATFNQGTVRQHKSMSFFFDIGVWSVIANVYSHVWVPFVTHGVYFGQRRVYLSAQVLINSFENVLDKKRRKKKENILKTQLH